ncbi:MAG: hypothetical protein J6C98_09685 [Oscillospiraceae bacterium]|nr:hypothetical protein [Oscillospiraceae bacterium]
MKLVQKGNKQLRIADDQLANYLARGFNEVDQKTGKIIAKEPADELKALKKENAALKKANKELTEQLEQLKAGQ